VCRSPQPEHRLLDEIVTAVRLPVAAVSDRSHEGLEAPDELVHGAVVPGSDQGQEGSGRGEGGGWGGGHVWDSCGAFGATSPQWA
jgi:hypothetical protein